MKNKTFSTLAAASAVAIAALSTAAAAQASDAYPCGRATTSPGGVRNVHYCPLTQGNVPVYNQIESTTSDGSRRVIGHLVQGGSANWFWSQFCDPSNGGEFHLGAYYNDWWGLTEADNGRVGWVPEVYFKGGGNNERDGGLPVTSGGQC